MKNRDHLFEFNSKVRFDCRIIGKDFRFSSFEDEYLFISEDIDLYLVFNLNVVDHNFIFRGKCDSPCFNINDPCLFFIFLQFLILNIEGESISFNIGVEFNF